MRMPRPPRTLRTNPARSLRSGSCPAHWPANVCTVPPSPLRAGGSGQSDDCRCTAYQLARSTSMQRRFSAVHQRVLHAPAVQPSRAELPGARQVLDPVAGRLGIPLALAGGLSPFVGPRLGGHRRGLRILLGVDFGVLPAFAAQGDQVVRCAIDVVFAAVACIGQTEFGQSAQVSPQPPGSPAAASSHPATRYPDRPAR